MSTFRSQRPRLAALALLGTCVICGLACKALATTYYVAPPPVGNDSNPGTLSRPFATPQKAANTVVAGDTVLVKPGIYRTYPGSDKVLWCQRKGTQTQRIVFKADGPRADVVLNNTGGGWNVNVEDYTTVDGFTIIGGNTGLRTAVTLGVTFQNCDVSRIPNKGIFVANAAYAQVLDNVIHDMYPWGDIYQVCIYISGNHETIEDTQQIVRGNVMYNWSGPGIWCNASGFYDERVGGLLIEGNVGFNMPCGLIGTCGVHDSIIRNNVAYANSTPFGVYPRGFISLREDSYNNTVVNNTCVGDQTHTGGGIELYGAVGGRGPAYDNTVFNNICITATKQIDDWSGSNTNKIANNFTRVYSSSVRNSIFEDPVAGNYHLLQIGSLTDIRNRGLNSVVSSRGETIAAPDFDRDGVPRPRGQIDIGAHEVSFELIPASNPAGSGSIVRTPDRLRFSYDAPEQVQLRAVPNSGYQFTSWSGLPVPSQNPQPVTVSQDLNVTANFTGGGAPPPVSGPQGLNGIEVSPGCMRLSWLANPEPDIAGYKVFYGQQSVAQGQVSNYSDSVNVGNVTIRDICSLSSNRYYFALKAYNTSGQQSSYSAEYSFYVKNSLTPGPFEVSRWTLDESSGGYAQDSWGSYGGTLANNPTWRTTGGPMNGALELDGTDDHVALGGADIPDGPGATIAFWFRADDFGLPEARFISKASGTTEASHFWMVGTVNSTGLRFRLKTGGVTTSLETTTGQIQTDTWYHVAATYDGQRMRIFKNGTLVKDAGKTGIVDRSSVAQAAIGIQPPTAGGGHAFDGLIDDVRIYRCALTEAEIDSLIALGPNTPPIARCTATPTSGFAPLTVNFNASASTDANGNPLSYAWSFGDNGTSTGSTVAHVYNNAGTYSAVVTVTDSGGKTDRESVVITVDESAGPPQPPVWDSLSETSPGCATLRWQPNAEPDLAGYVVYHGPLSVARGETTRYADSLVVGITTTRVVCDLPQGARYFALRARNVAGDLSGFSSERELYIVGPDITSPVINVVRPAPGSVGHDPRDVQIYFTVSDDRTGVDSTTVSVLVNGSPAVGVTFNGDPMMYTVACRPNGDLPSNSTVTVSVTVRDRASPPNNQTQSWNFATSAIPPSAPTGLHGQQASAGCISAGWLANPEMDLAGYTMYFGSASVVLGQASQYSDSVFVGLATSHTACALTAGTYYVALRAKNTSGQLSSFSGEITVQVAPEAPQGPAPPQQVQVSENTPGCMRVAWAANAESDLSGYVLYYGPSSVAQGQTTQYRDSVNVGAATSKEICNLSAGTLFVAVRAFNTGGMYSSYSTEKRIDILGRDLEPPVVAAANPLAGAVGVRQDADIVFVVTDNLSGIDINSMEVRVNGSLERNVAYSGDPSQYGVACNPANELPEMSLVTVEVRVSDRSPVPNRTTANWSFTTGTNRPSLPQNVSATGTNTGCATVRWNASPESDVTGYRIYFGTSSVAGGQAQAYDDSVTVGRMTAYTLCGLLDARYYFALRAKNSLGYLSNLSQEVSASVTNPVVEAPSAPQQLRVSESEPGCVLVKWRANSEPDVTGYTIYHRRISEGSGGTSSYVDSVVAGNVTEKKICGFERGTYAFTVKAYNTAGLHSAFSTEKWLDVIGPDTNAPSLVVGGPLHGAVDVPPNTPLFFVVSDNQAGIDAGSLAVLINGSPPERVSLTGDKNRYTVVCELGDVLPRNTLVIVQVTVRDLATPANTTVYRWSFSTGAVADTSPPVFIEITPNDGATGVSRTAVVRVGLRDKSGIDVGSVSFFVDGALIPGVSIREEPDGDVFIQYTRPNGFAPLSTVEIEVQAYDMAANFAQTAFSFQTAETAGEPGAVVTIAPDGYWAGDPDRPLEIRGIPPGWQVRIFDTSGVQIRAFTNTADTTIDWTWDFANGHGNRVAKSLYLIRVLDKGGSVKQSGKFVVQTASR